MAQQFIVGLIVLAAALYVLWRYLPGRWRHGLGKVHPGLIQSPGCGASDGGCSSCKTRGHACSSRASFSVVAIFYIAAGA